MAVKPQDVKSPKAHWTLIDVAVETADWSLAVGEWDEERRLAARWNGDDEHPKGNPVSHGVPTWFVLPDEFINPLLASGLLPPEKASLARDYLRRPAPGQDLDALVAQITDANRHREITV